MAFFRYGYFICHSIERMHSPYSLNSNPNGIDFSFHISREVDKVPIIYWKFKHTPRKINNGNNNEAYFF